MAEHVHTLSYDLSVEDFRALYQRTLRQHVESSAEWKMYRADNARLLGLCVALTVGAAWFAYANRGVLIAPRLSGGSVLPLVAVVGAGYFWWWWWKRRQAASDIGVQAQIEEAIKHPSVEYHCGHVELSLGAGGLHYRTADEDILQAWSGLREINESEDFIVFARRDERIFVVPRRAILDAAALLRDCRRWLADGGHSDEAVIARFLHVRDEPCPACRHNLRGIVSGRCPECGLQLNRETFRAAFVRERRAGE